MIQPARFAVGRVIVQPIPAYLSASETPLGTDQLPIAFKLARCLFCLDAAMEVNKCLFYLVIGTRERVISLVSELGENLLGPFQAG